MPTIRNNDNKLGNHTALDNGHNTDYTRDGYYFCCGDGDIITNHRQHLPLSYQQTLCKITL